MNEEAERAFDNVDKFSETQRLGWLWFHVAVRDLTTNETQVWEHKVANRTAQQVAKHFYDWVKGKGYQNPIRVEVRGPSNQKPTSWPLNLPPDAVEG